MGEPSFWDDPEKASRITKEVDGLKSEVDEYKELETGLDDLEVLQEMAAEEQDESLIPELDENLTKIKENLHHLELGMLLSEEYDANNAILTLHAGAGGTEAQDWTSMLLGFFRSEKGVHRLVRISPFDANARRHTSFSAVDVMPELDDTVNVEINMDDSTSTRLLQPFA